MSQSRVRDMIYADKLKASRVGGRRVIRRRDVERLARLKKSSGRPLSERHVWGLLWLVLGREQPWLSAKARYRLRKRLEERGIEPEEMLPRCQLKGYRVHASVRDKISARPLVQSGVGVAATQQIDIVGDDPFEAYVRPQEYERLVKEYRLRESEDPNVVLRVVSDIWPFEPSERIAPQLVVALDLWSTATAVRFIGKKVILHH